jgi:hypothetical protein
MEINSNMALSNHDLFILEYTYIPYTYNYSIIVIVIVIVISLYVIILLGKHNK